MRNLKKFIAIASLVMSVFLLIGCGQGQSAADKANDELIKQREAKEKALANQATTTTVLPWKNIDASEAENLIHSNGALQLIDVRDDISYSSKHITGATPMPLGEFQASYTKIDKAKPVLLYDDDGSLSAEAAKFLISHGYTNIYTLSGGMEQWSFEVEPKSAQ